jgi:hypothetical protein
MALYEVWWIPLLGNTLMTSGQFLPLMPTIVGWGWHLMG